MTRQFLFYMLIFGIQFNLSGQDIECGNSGIITFTDIECDGTYVTFMATSTTTNSTSAYFTGVPPGSQVTYDGFPFITLSDGTRQFSVSHMSEPTIFNMPSTSCEPIALNFTFASTSVTNNMECTFPVLIEADNRAIPTLGQWGLIVLAFLTIIIGITKIQHIYKRDYRF